MATPSETRILESLFQSALEEYQKQTRINLVGHPLAAQLEHCDNVESITEVLQGQARAFLEFRGRNKSVITLLKHMVEALHKLSGAAPLAESIGFPVPIVKTIHTGIGILLGAIEGVSSSYDALNEILEEMSSFLQRLDIYTKIPLAIPMTRILVKWLVELLSILALATKQVKQGRWKKFGKKFVGDNDVEQVLRRLNRLSLEEARVTAALTLQAAHGNSKEAMSHGLSSIDAIQPPLSNEDKRNRDQLRQEIQKWLSPPDPRTNYNIGREAHHEGTGEWLIEGETFAEWKSSSSSNSLLWIHGKPGSGKSTLSSTIIENIECMCEQGQASLAFYYFDFRDTEKNHLRGLLSSLLWQLCDQSDSFCDIVSQLHSTHENGKKIPTDRELSQCLNDILRSPGQTPIYLVFDGLDECPNASGTPSNREKLLMLVGALVDLPISNLRICLTSRPEVDIQAVLDRSEFRSISLHDEEGQKQDIIDYIISIVRLDPRTRSWKEEVKDLVIDVLSQKANGMFRWVWCQFDFLRRCAPETIPQVLDKLPPTLDATYDRTLQDIEEQNWEHAHLLFQCVAAASSPLRVEELVDFLAFDFQAGPIPKFSEDLRRGDPVHAVLSTCSSLFALVNTGDSQVIQFSHFTVKEYLTSSRLARASNITFRRYYISMKRAHAIAAQACLGILLHLDESVTTVTLQRFPLAEYAAEYWLDHARFEDVSKIVEYPMKQLFDPRKPHLAIWVWIHEPDVPLWDREITDSKQPSPPRATPLHYAALCGLHTIVKFLIIEHLQDVHAQGFNDESTPLHSASFGGHVEVALTLLENGANVTAETFDQLTPLHAASSMGHAKLARILLERGASVTARNEDWNTPLHMASEEGHMDVVRILLEYGADPKAEDEYGKTPFVDALQGGHQEVARILFWATDRLSDGPHRAPMGWTPSSDDEDESVVEMDID